MSDETARLRALEYVRLICGEFGPAQSTDVLSEITIMYLVWLGSECGRDEIDRLLRERVNTYLVRREHRKIELAAVDGRRVG